MERGGKSLRGKGGTWMLEEQAATRIKQNTDRQSGEPADSCVTVKGCALNGYNHVVVIPGVFVLCASAVEFLDAPLNWIGSPAVIEHHQEVPVRPLESGAELSCGEPMHV